MFETRRERLAVFGGAPAIAVLIYMLLAPDSATEADRAENPPRPPVVAARVPQVAAPQPLALPAAPQPEAPPPQRLSLHGVMGGGGGSAIIGYPDGTQRLIVVGREAAPGMVLREVQRSRVVLASATGDVVLRLDGSQTAMAFPAGAQTGAEPAATAAAAISPARQRAEASRYRGALAPRRANGRTTGYALRPNVSLPLLQRAGLRPGDVLVAVNGQTFDSEERVLDLPREIAGSYTAEFEFERAGRRMRASLPVNPR